VRWPRKSSGAFGFAGPFFGYFFGQAKKVTNKEMEPKRKRRPLKKQKHGFPPNSHYLGWWQQITGKRNYVPGPVLLFTFRCVAPLYVQNATEHFTGIFQGVSLLIFESSFKRFVNLSSNSDHDPGYSATVQSAVYQRKI
jgi:hypothetical protein